ncbi:MAG TPA: response regulator transcription factor [Xanthobacteraceae bacterium]|nr:response regulator transcription factor [Xanthobacteraceae bacterium]
MSPFGLSTIVLERQLLLREGLISLISHFSFDVIAGANEVSDIVDLTLPDESKATLFILGSSYQADQAIADAKFIKEHWHNSKIVLLTQQIGYFDFQKIIDSCIIACIPLFVSRDTLIKALDLVAVNGVRIMMAIPESGPAVLPQPTQTATDEPNADRTIPQVHIVKTAQISIEHPAKGPRLSEREIQILDGLIRGHANKLIARSCDITEATVKVHMKSILRKIQVSNRTQAAVWALANGHSGEDLRQRLHTASAG